MGEKEIWFPVCFWLGFALHSLEGKSFYIQILANNGGVANFRRYKQIECVACSSVFRMHLAIFCRLLVEKIGV